MLCKRPKAVSCNLYFVILGISEDLTSKQAKMLSFKKDGIRGDCQKSLLTIPEHSAIKL